MNIHIKYPILNKEILILLKYFIDTAIFKYLQFKLRCYLFKQKSYTAFKDNTRKLISEVYTSFVLQCIVSIFHKKNQ